MEKIIEQIENCVTHTSTISGILKVLIDDQVLIINGTKDTNEVSFEDQYADCTITLSYDHLHGMVKGARNPLEILLDKEVKVEGNAILAIRSFKFFK